jgi:hypothetical protein
MGSHPAQAFGITAFLLGFTALAAGAVRGSVVLYLASGFLVVGSFVILHKCKQMEDSEV